MACLKKILLIIVILIAIIVASLGGAYYFYKPTMIGEEQREETIIITENMTGSEIGRLLYEKKLIPSEEGFRLALRVTGLMDRLQKGYYRIPNDKTMNEVMAILQRGDVHTIRFTIPEGWDIRDIAKGLAHNQLGSESKILEEAKTLAPYMYMYGPKPVDFRVEGFLFPSTYEVPVDAKEKDILLLFAKEMNKQLTPAMRQEIEKQKMTIYEFLTLASLVEREALLDEDRPLIAAAFKKRLAINMPLQSCASIQYLLGENKPRLSIADTQINSPYNTYLHAGLPPGPIANPGLASMKAVLEAKDTDLIFFVADKKGHHHFTKTYEEHLAVVEAIYGKE